MKKIIFFSVILFLCKAAFAQDSLHVTFSEVQDTLVRQYFIDRYENVFMTKVPSQSILKLGYATSLVRGSGLNLGYEYKILPSFSIEAGAYFETNAASQAINRYMFLKYAGAQSIFEDVYLNAKARWYYNMKNRIVKGLNANNFSGNYLAFSYEQSFIFQNKWPHSGSSQRRMGIQYGFQSRFLNNGFVDFSVGLFHRPASDYEDFIIDKDQSRYRISNFRLATQMNFGLGVGSWKRQTVAPGCELLVCNEDIKDQWKLDFPYLNIGTRLQDVNSKIAYERKIARSPFSLTADLAVLFRRDPRDFLGINYGVKGWDLNAGLTGGLQLRYYYLQKQQMRKGKGGNSFSGPYISIVSKYSTSYSESYSSQFEGNVSKGHSSTWVAGVNTGYQLRFLRRFFVDANLHYLRYQSLKESYSNNHNFSRNDWNFAVGFGFVF